MIEFLNLIGVDPAEDIDSTATYVYFSDDYDVGNWVVLEMEE